MLTKSPFALSSCSSFLKMNRNVYYADQTQTVIYNNVPDFIQCCPFYWSYFVWRCINGNQKVDYLIMLQKQPFNVKYQTKQDFK